ncbi:MAG: class I SAM-dependent methyltransferase [Chitinophagaceae bacterium]
MRIERNINDGFFNSVYKEVWRKLIPEGLSTAETDFIESVANLKNNDRVLDTMCGYGRHTLDLARRGYRVTAVDNLPEYIAEISQLASTEDLPVEGICSSLQQLQLQQDYDAIICMGNSFAFFNEGEALSILKNFSNHLKDGGIFIINTWMLAEIAIKFFREKDWFYVADYKYLVENQYLFHPARIESQHTIIRQDGAIESIKGVDYIFTVDELSAMLTKAGFSLAAIYSTPRQRPFQFGDSRAYLVATRDSTKKEVNS